LPFKGVTLLLKATLPTCVLSRRGLSLLQHAPRSSPYDTGAGPHASCKLAQGGRSQTAARGARNCPAVTSASPLSPRPAGERADRHAGRHATAPRGHTLSTSTRPAWRPRPTRHVTGAPVTTCKKLHCHSSYYRASSTAEPVPRFEATLHMTQQCQPGTSVTGQPAAGEGATVDTTRNGPAVMAVAGRRKQRSSRQASSRPLLGQRENPLPRHEDDVPMFRSSNGSRTPNGYPANHLSRRINAAAGQAAPLAGEAGDASLPP
jgi:predicted CxxxxCH...CXXCH cytochrome family protein